MDERRLARMQDRARVYRYTAARLEQGIDPLRTNVWSWGLVVAAGLLAGGFGGLLAAHLGASSGWAVVAGVAAFVAALVALFAAVRLDMDQRIAEARRHPEIR